MAAIINTEKITEGMVVAKDVLNSSGFVLIPAGTALTERHKRVLITWDVNNISIVDGKGNETPNLISEEVREMSLEAIRSKIKWFPNYPIEHDLIESAILRLASLNLNRGEE